MLQPLKNFLLSVIFALIFTHAYSQVIPPENRIDWSQAGCRFFLPESVPEVSILSFGGSNNGLVDNTNALNTAMETFGGHPGRIYFPVGTYLFSSSVSMPDSIILKGAGSDSTFIKIAHSSTGFNFSGSAANTFTDIITGFHKGSQKITVANPSLFTAGKYCEIKQENGSWDTNPATWADYSVGQMVQIQSIIGDTLVLYDYLHLDYDTAMNLQIQQINPCSASSISCLNVLRTDVSTTATGYNFAFNYAVNCEISGIESNKSQGSHCIIGASSHVSVSGCYFHDAYMYDGAGTKGYGVTLITHASLCLVQNNIFNHLRHAMMTKQGANGNVFGYNYSINPFRNGYMEYPQNYCGDISMHGHYSFANLFEGNIVQTIYTDQTWGPTGPYNTLFRNRVELYGIIMTSSLTNKQNIVGNEITGTGSTWPFNHGAYTIVGTGHIQYGNNKNGVIVPTDTTVLNDMSYYLQSEPLYWNINQSWPNIGIPNVLKSGTIPAKERFLIGNFTDCSRQGIITNFQEKESSKFLVYPNPATDILFLEFPPESFSKTIIISSIEGKCLIRTKTQAGANKTEIDLSSLKSGIYFLSAETETGTVVMKVIKQL